MLTPLFELKLYIYIPKKFTRRQQVAITRLRLGHTNLTHSFLMNKSPPPTCNYCNQTLTVKHLLDECSEFSSIKTNLKLPSILSPLLKDEQTKIISFLQVTNIIKLL